MAIEKDKRKPERLMSPDFSKKIDRRYFCPGKTIYSFYIPILKDGEPIPRLTTTGQQLYIGNTPVFIDKKEVFERISHKQDKLMCGYTLRANDPEYEIKLKELERLVNDMSSPVMDLEMYEAYKNPEMAEARKEIDREREEKQNAIDQLYLMQQENERLRKEIAEKKGGN